MAVDGGKFRPCLEGGDLQVVPVGGSSGVVVVIDVLDGLVDVPYGVFVVGVVLAGALLGNRGFSRG
jgi:hypothetical protein